MNTTTTTTTTEAVTETQFKLALMLANRTAEDLAKTHKADEIRAYYERIGVEPVKLAKAKQAADLVKQAKATVQTFQFQAATEEDPRVQEARAKVAELEQALADAEKLADAEGAPKAKKAVRSARIKLSNAKNRVKKLERKAKNRAAKQAERKSGEVRVCGNVVTREAVLAVLARFDAEGEEAVLAASKWGKAKSWLLHHEGKTYPSKAVLGLAGNVEGRFVGGKPVADRLARLGFEVKQ